MSKPLSKLKEIREDKFLSQQELAALAKVSQSTISHAESGKRISLGHIKLIAAALKVRPERLI